MSERAMRASTCVDCGLALLGEHSRCPSCHDRHAACGAVSPASDDDNATVPRPRALVPGFVVRWLVTVELIGIVVLVTIFALRGCR